MLKHIGQVMAAVLIAVAMMAGASHAADVDAGKKIFKKCKSCHGLEKGGANKLGPNLWGIVGRDVASMDGFKYSGAMKDYGGNWSPDRLDAFLTKPKKEIKGTKMSFSGLKKEKDRVNLIAYLSSMSDSPLVLGNASEAVNADYGILKIAKGVDVTYSYCASCHSEKLVAQQGLTRDAWDDLIVWVVDTQGAAPIAEPDRTEILDYLEINYGPGQEWVESTKVAPDTDAEFGVLFAATGAEETYAYCTACHSERIVAQQGLIKNDWVELLEWMADEQDMDEIEEPDYSMIIDYLSVNYGVDRPNFPN